MFFSVLDIELGRRTRLN